MSKFRKINTEYIRPVKTESELLTAKNKLKTKFETSKIAENVPLFLILKKQYFDEILAGTKDKEFREDSEFYRSRLMTKNQLFFRNYKHVVFQNGYHKDARKITVEIKKITLGFRFIIHLNKVIDKNF